MAADLNSHDDRLIWDTWLSMHRLPVLTVADEIGLFAALSSAALPTVELAAKLGVDARALQVHLGVLAATGFVERRAGDWSATEAARPWLRLDADGYYGPVLRFYAQTNPLHKQLLETLRTGQRAEDHISATDKWEAGQMSAEAAARITAYMDVYGHAAARGAAKHSWFSDAERLLDVGGGSAIYSIELAKAWPWLNAMVVDIDAVCEVARQQISAAALSGRIGTCPVNMFRDDWPTGYDVHFLSNIFHDWDEDSDRQLALRSFSALPPGGRIILHEMLMDDDGSGPLHSALFSLVMLLGTKGRQYSLSELESFLTDAGFVVSVARERGGSSTTGAAGERKFTRILS